MVNYKLLTPGPLTTTDTVKSAMMVDHDTWDDDYKNITQEIRQELLDLAQLNDDYTCVLLQGSGTYTVEGVLDSVVGPEDKLLVLTNGAYGRRMAEICDRHQLNYVSIDYEENEVPRLEDVVACLDQDPDINCLAMVHCETTSGILNPLEEIAEEANKRGLTFIVDAMSSFGGVDIDWPSLDAEYIISSANKCIQGVPGFGFVLAKRSALEQTKGKATTLSLDIYDQWLTMEKDNGKFRFTSPTHTVIAFRQAIRELHEEGGVSARAQRFAENNQLIRDRLKEIDLEVYIDEDNQSPIISSFLYPDHPSFDFMPFYNYIKERGYAIYPGKVSRVDSFRIGNIGEIYPEDMTKLANIIEEYMEELND